MREIKFRAWDKRGKCMWWNVQNAYDTLGNHSTPNPEHHSDDDDHDLMCSSFGEVLEEMEVMQYTGLKDKNGKEIYEGDVVRFYFTAERGLFQGKGKPHPDYTEMNDTVTFSEGCFFAMCPDTGGGKFLRDLEGICEVISNIHENPELLEAK